jgi:Uncharacterised protein family (UPF0158)
MTIDWEGLIVGFESRSHLITHFFDRQTGEVEQVLERDDGGERTRGDLEEFLEHCKDPECRKALQGALDSSDSAARYREVLLRHPKEEARFFQFKEHQALERAQRWLSEMGIAFAKPQREM